MTRIKGWFQWLWEHRTKTLGILGVIAGCTQNYLEANNIAILPAKLRGLVVGILGMLVFLVGLYNSIRMSMRGPD